MDFVKFSNFEIKKKVATTELSIYSVTVLLSFTDNDDYNEHSKFDANFDE